MAAGEIVGLGIEGVIAFIQTAEGKDLLRLVREGVDAIERKGITTDAAVAAVELAADESENVKFGR